MRHTLSPPRSLGALAAKKAIQLKGPGMKHSILISMLQSSELLCLKELETKPVHHNLRASIALVSYCQKEELLDHMVSPVLFNNALIVVYDNGASYIQKALDSRIVKYSLAKVLSQPTPFDMRIFFHSPCFLKIAFRRSRWLLHVATRVGREAALLFRMLWRAWEHIPSRLGWGSVQEEGVTTINPVKQHYSDVQVEWE